MDYSKGHGGNTLLCLGAGCLKLCPLASTEVREALHVFSCKKSSVSVFFTETHPLLRDAARTGHQR